MRAWQVIPRFAVTVTTLLALFLAVEAQSTRKEKIAGPESQKQCLEFGAQFKSSNGLELTDTFTQYFAEGEMPSLERLVSLYPNGIIPDGVNVPGILKSVGPDVDFRCDDGYARTSSPAGRRAPNGGMPAFCRFGSYIKTSPLTRVFMELWMREC